MTDEQIRQNAEKYALKEGNGKYYRDLECGYIAGAHSMLEEIEHYRRIATTYKIDAQDTAAECERLHDIIDKLRNPWISVKDMLPEEPLTICAVWLKEDDLVPHISLYDSGRFLLLPVDVTVTHWMPIPTI